jgi:hypothetical protein
VQHFVRKRVESPMFLRGPEVAGARRQLLQFFKHSFDRRTQSRAPQMESKINHPSVVAALSSLFRGKCAFCEGLGNLQVYRLRPPYEALPLARDPNAHLYYCWLSEAWENLYPICPGCHPSNPHHFPTVGDRVPIPNLEEIVDYVSREDGWWGAHPPKERPLLLDPCMDLTYDEHFDVALSGAITAMSKRAEETIAQFNLNRPDLVERRRRTFDDYARNLAAFAAEGETHPIDRSEVVIRPIPNFEDMEFGGTWFLYLRARIPASFPETNVTPSSLRRLLADSERARFFAPIIDSEGGVRAAPRTTARPRAKRKPPPKQDLPMGAVAQVEIENFKSLEKVVVLLPKAPESGLTDSAPERVPALLILGENATGKSSILEAIALTLADDAMCQALGRPPADFVLNPRFMTDEPRTRPAAATVAVLLEEVEGRQPRRELRISKRSFAAASKGDFRAAPIFAYGAFRQYLDKVPRYRPDKHVRSLFHSNFLLPNPEKWLLGLAPRRFNEVVQAIREILSIEGDFEVLQKDSEHVYVAYAVAGAGGVQRLSRTPLAMVSSGFRAILAMVCDICQGLMDRRRVNPDFETLKQSRAIVLIDEVEAHLHPRWKMQIMRGLRNAFPRVTFIVTTHDPLCIRGMRDGEVLVLQRVPGETVADTELPSFVEVLVDLPNVSELSVEQLLTSDLFQINSTDAPEAEENFAKIAHFLARRASGDKLDPTESDAIERFRDHVAKALPIGSSQAQQLIQQAVAEHLRERRTRTAEQLEALNEKTKAAIRAALADI